MDDPEHALIDINLAASTLKQLADTCLIEAETLKLAESLLFVARGLSRSYEALRPLVVDAAVRRAARPLAVVVPFREVTDDA